MDTSPHPSLLPKFLVLDCINSVAMALSYPKEENFLDLR